MATAAPVPAPATVLDPNALLLFPRMAASLVFVSFAAVFSLSVNTRLGILSAGYQAFNKDVLARKQLILTTTDERDRKYQKRTLRVLMFDMSNQTVHIKIMSMVLVGVLFAVAFWALTTMCACLSAVSDRFIYPAVIFLWLGFLVFVPVLLGAMYDIYRSFGILRQEANAVTEFKKYVLEDLGFESEQ